MTRTEMAIVLIDLLARDDERARRATIFGDHVLAEGAAKWTLVSDSGDSFVITACEDGRRFRIMVDDD